LELLVRFLWLVALINKDDFQCTTLVLNKWKCYCYT